MTEPIETFREEFEQWFDDHTNKNYGVAYYVGADGKYCFSDIELAWQTFLHVKRSQPVVELPGESPMIFALSGFEKHELIEALTAAGIQYRIKGE